MGQRGLSGRECTRFRSVPVFYDPSYVGYDPGPIQLILRDVAKSFVERRCFHSGIPVVRGNEARYFGDMARTILWAMNTSKFVRWADSE